MFCSFSSAEALAGYSSENSNDKKKSKRALDGGKSKKAGTSLPLFPLLLSPTRFLSTLARASLRHKDAAGGGGGGEGFFLTALRPSLSRVSFTI